VGLTVHPSDTKYAKLVLRRLELDIFPHLGARPIADIDVSLPMEVVRLELLVLTIEEDLRWGSDTSLYTIFSRMNDALGRVKQLFSETSENLVKSTPKEIPKYWPSTSPALKETRRYFTRCAIGCDPL
jgi:hypothetical protein